MRELKNSEIEAVCGAAKARPGCGPVAVPVRRPTLAALVGVVLAKIFGVGTPATKEAA